MGRESGVSSRFFNDVLNALPRDNKIKTHSIQGHTALPTGARLSFTASLITIAMVWLVVWSIVCSLGCRET